MAVLAIFLYVSISNAQANVCTNLSPEFGLTPVKITASRDQGASPCRLMDNDLSTVWSAETRENGELASLTFEFNQISDFDQIQIIFDGDARSYKFDIQTSNDGSSWSTILLDQLSTRDVLEMQNFNFGNQSAKYLRYVGKGCDHPWSSQQNNNKINEIRIVNTNISGPSEYDPDFTLRINAGGSVDSTFENKLFIADDHFMNGTQFSNTQTGLNEPYVSERWGNTNTMSYDIPVNSGAYQVVLHFAELYFGAAGSGLSNGGPGKRIFDVTIEGVLELDNFDINAKVGPQTPTTESFTVNVNDGKLNIDFSSLGTDGGVAQPKISAIEVLGSNFISGTPNSGTSLWSQSPANTNDIFYTTGNVGIGTTPQTNYRLAIDGKIHTKEVIVSDTGWADYVFFKDYQLPTLQEVENHIKKNGHLMNIPSAAEVEANGIELGEMNKLLLEKIEELTLYIIELDKKVSKK